MDQIPLILAPVIGVVVLLLVFVSCAMAWRTIVSTNEVHIVQRNKTSTPYGTGQKDGNVYWEFPKWIPFIGTEVIELPVSIFTIELDAYDAYDAEKVPFAVDVISFFQIEDPITAARRINEDGGLHGQLQNVLRGAVRKVLASKDILTIMETRSELNATFLAEVQNSVGSWGVRVNSIEFTDILDGPGTKVVTNIMERKRSKIEKESRIEVAENMRDAQLKEIEAKQTAQIRATEAEEAVQSRDAERVKKVGVTTEQAKQDVQEQAQITSEREVAVARTKAVGQANYEKEKRTVEAEAEAAATIAINQGRAEAVKIEAIGYRDAQLAKAEGDAKLIGETGRAEAEVIKAKGYAAAEAKIKEAEALAKIQKEGLQAQLGEKAINAHRDIGVAMAQAYSDADIKAVITQGGGIESLGDLLSAPGGAKIASFVEALKKTSGGKNVLEALGFGQFVTPPAVDPVASKAQAK